MDSGHGILFIQIIFFLHWTIVVIVTENDRSASIIKIDTYIYAPRIENATCDIPYIQLHDYDVYIEI